MHKSYHTIAYVKTDSCAAPGRRMRTVQLFEINFQDAHLIKTYLEMKEPYPCLPRARFFSSEPLTFASVISNQTQKRKDAEKYF